MKMWIFGSPPFSGTVDFVRRQPTLSGFFVPMIELNSRMLPLTDIVS
jgi:hypothetical protein